MVDVPISWKITITGARDAKNQLAALQNEFGRDEGLKRFNQGVREGSRETIALGRAINYNNRAWAVSHNNLREASRAVNVFGRAMRGAMSIMNTLNLLTVAQSSATTGIKQSMADASIEVLELERDLKELEKHGKKNTVEYQIKVQELEAAKQKLKDLETELKKVADNEFWTKITTIGFAITEGLQVGLMALNNEKIGKIIFGAASKLGTLFGGIFTGFSTLIIKAGTWLSQPLTALGPKVGITGTALGTLFGTAFTIAAAAALTTGIVIAIDALYEKYGGGSPLKSVGLPSGAETIKTTTGIDILEGKDPQAESIRKTYTGVGKEFFDDDFGKQKSWFDSIFAHAETMPKSNGTSIEWGGGTGKFRSDISAKPLPVILSEIKSGAKFKDLLPETVFAGNVTNIPTGQAKPMVDNTEEIEKSTEESREERKERRDQVREQVLATIADEKAKLALKQATFEQTEAANALKMEMAALNTLMEQGFQGSFYNSGVTSGGIGGTDFVATDQNGDGIIEGSDVTGSLHATGFSGVINKPHMFIAGENGPEKIDIVPLRGNGGRNGMCVTINNYISGSIIAHRELERITMDTMKNQLKRAGF